MNKKLALISFLSLIIVVGLMVVGTHKAIAAAVITTPATGNVSSDSHAPGASVALPNILITEGAIADIAVGAIVLTAPTGYVFDDAAAAPNVIYTGAGLAGDAAATVAPTTLTVNITNVSTVAGTMRIGSVNPIKVRVSAGCPVSPPGNILMTGGVIAGLNGASNFGTLTQVVGTMTFLAVRLPDQAVPACAAPAGTVTDEVVGVPFNITKIYAVDTHFNTDTAYAGVGKVLVYAGPTGVPAYTTVVTFVAGESTTVLATTLNIAEKKTITVTDAGNFSLASSLQAVNPVAIADLVCASSGQPGTIYLSWTVPVGVSVGYDVRYLQNTAINSEPVFAGATPFVNNIVPGTPNQPSGQQLVTGLIPSATYFFSVKAEGNDNTFAAISAPTGVTCAIESGASSAATQISSPSSAIISPASGSTSKAETAVTITGNSSDNGVSSIKKVEVSTDGGTTWAEATPVASNNSYGFSWTYNWIMPAEGPHVIKSRATNWVGVVEIPGAGISLTILPKSGIVYTGTSTPSTVQITSASSVAQIQAAIITLQTQLLNLLQQLLALLTAQLGH